MISTPLVSVLKVDLPNCTYPSSTFTHCFLFPKGKQIHLPSFSSSLQEQPILTHPVLNSPPILGRSRCPNKLGEDLSGPQTRHTNSFLKMYPQCYSMLSSCVHFIAILYIQNPMLFFCHWKIIFLV